MKTITGLLNLFSTRKRTIKLRNLSEFIKKKLLSTKNSSKIKKL